VTKVRRAEVVARLRQVADRIERGEVEATPALVKVLGVEPEGAVSADRERKAPRISKAILDELEWRFENDTGAGLPAEEAIKKAVQTVRSTRRKASA
jgi:hypothetical protein